MVLAFLLSLAANAQRSRRDGNRWNAEDRGEKLDDVTGFFDGMELGNKFRYWGIVDKHGEGSKCPSENS